MAQNTRTIAVHQLLHGYEGGHKLLAASRELPPAVARKVLVQSDLSGSIPPKTFETYLTGYPLREISTYAFARTWYAPEMPRPGCVWTHTLLIGADDVATIPSLSSFLECFTRPQPGEFKDFRTPLQGQVTDAAFEKNILPSDCEGLLRAFYGAESNPVVMAGNEQGVFETLFIELWSQLWPQARLDFTFSTGSLSARKFDARPFDVQLAPTSAVREVVRASGAILAQRDEPPSPDELDPGVNALVADFISHGLLGLRHFLAEVADAGFVRRDAVRAALVQDLLPGGGKLTESDAPKLLQTVAANFPAAEQAETLKRYCFAAIERSEIPQVDRWIIIQVATHDYGEAFASPGIGLSDRMTRLINQDSGAALDLLLKLFGRSLNRFGEQIAYAIISTQTDAQILGFLRRNPQFVSTFVKVRPALAAKSEFWTALESHSHEILEAVAAAKTADPGELNRVFSALFLAQLDREANHFLSLFGSAAVAAIFTHRGSYPANLRDRWIDALAARPDLIENFLKDVAIITPEILAGVSATYSPTRVTEGNFPLGKWLTALAAWHSKFAPHLGATVETCSFSLAIAFRHSGQLSADLCKLSFQNAHAAAAAQTMPYSAWSMLEALVPHISWLKDWDRCERMRRALINHFTNDHWPLASIFQILHAADTLQEFMNTASYLPEGRRLLERVIAGIEDGTIPVEPSQINIVADTLRLRIRVARR
jgi:hypothetical protein